MKYTVEVKMKNEWRTSALYSRWLAGRQSLPDIVNQAKTIFTAHGINITKQYRIVDSVTNEVVTEFTHDNLWLLERML